MKIDKKYIVICSLCLIVLILGIYFLIKTLRKEKYETQKVDTCTITQIVDASGTINPVNTVSVGSTVSGLIKEIRFPIDMNYSEDNAFFSALWEQTPDINCWVLNKQMYYYLYDS